MSNEPDAIINGKAVFLKMKPAKGNLQFEFYKMLSTKRFNCFGHHGQGNCSCEHCRSIREDRYCNCDFCNRTRKGE